MPPWSLDSGAVWEKEAKDIPETWTQGTGVADATTGMYAITLNDMVGKAMYDAEGNIASEWDAFMNQLTWDELCAICNNGYHLTVAVPTIGKI